MKKGFTLIEIIIYIALFSLLIGSAFIVTFQIIDNSGKLSTKNTTEEEGNFVMRKFAYALTGINPAFPITPSVGTSPTLTVTKYGGNKIDVQLNGTKIEMKESVGGGPFLPITTDNVSVSNLQFTYITPTGTAPAGITAMAVINGVVFTTTKYIRK